MSLLKGKHVVKEIQEVRCTIVEEGINQQRLDFLTKILELNGYEVRFVEEVVPEPPPPPEGEEATDQEPTAPKEKTFMLGVTSMIFNPVIAVYQRMLKNESGQRITPDYWNQKTDKIEPNYWDLSKKDF